MNKYPITLLFFIRTYRFSFTDPYYRYRSISFKKIFEDVLRLWNRLKFKLMATIFGCALSLLQL